MSILKQVRRTILDNHLLKNGETVVVGVSGGPDSLTLLDILHELSTEFAIKLHVAHLNHQLRGTDSNADAAFVAQTAGALGLIATVQARPVREYGQEHHLSMEEAARVMRYRFLGEVAIRTGARTIAVGHNADDQAETVVMHLLRGAGLAGLRGMAYKSRIPFAQPEIEGEGTWLQIVRPLLDVERNEIERYCQEHGLAPRIDMSNLDTSLFRNRIRREVIPYLEQLNPNLRQVLRHSAHALTDDYEYMHSVTESIFTQVAAPQNSPTAGAKWAGFVFDREKWKALPPSLQRATLREAVRRLRSGLRNINWTHIEDARRVALEKGVGAEATMPQGLVLVVGYDDLTIGETVSLPDMPLIHGEGIELRVGETSEVHGSGWQVKVEGFGELGPGEEMPRQSLETNVGRWTAEFDAEKIQGKKMLRTRRPGERFEPKGLRGRHKSLHEFMIEQKIPKNIRDLWPILADDDKILWVCGYRSDERACVTEETKRVLKVEFFKYPESG